ncbi:NAD(P)-dependent oxidoreductase [Neobacillus massiliamazoniensis]|jgi:putative NADH-flavin reductase|uniref:NAD(P)-binding Rossmann-fold domain-containing protein n=1 Tax=Neobacillus massiliamazoniensis TaxID=1499688 RepID=A0A0U1NVQ5_9BACI|nr:NAD(P)-dependent oxidoreductase [Neobacillus massiliamazoniensis]CRK82124.1 NAD(P)-binding Rossmann-fold domain-containing protein [Neobacillus massiliamazoniensis]
MKIGIIGASGKSGKLILKEAVERGHEVTAIVRDAAKVQNQQVAVMEKNIFDLVAEDIKGFDVVVNAFNAAPGQEHQHVEAGKVLIDVLKGAPSTRLIVVGGAGSLFVDEEKTLRVFDTPNFPEAYLATAKNMGKNLEELQNTTGIKWTYISPAGFFNPEGKRTGSYQTGKDNLMLNAKGESYISYADYAIAVIDEIENPQHVNERFTVVAEAE